MTPIQQQHLSAFIRNAFDAAEDWVEQLRYIEIARECELVELAHEMDNDMRTDLNYRDTAKSDGYAEHTYSENPFKQ